MDQEQILDKMYENLEKCCTESREFVNEKGEILEFNICCDNRVCDKQQCKDHRFYKYMKEHKEQIKELEREIYKPKAWIFTLKKYRLVDLDKNIIRQKFQFLYDLCKKYSSSHYSIHMEIKIYKNGDAYLHFHVVSGGFRKSIRFLMYMWGGNILYEQAIRPYQLSLYISKYASKTQKFYYNIDMELYFLLTYKQYMHRYSIRNCKTIVNSHYISMDKIRNEVIRSYYKDSYKNPNSKNKYYFKILEKDEIKQKGIYDYG